MYEENTWMHVFSKGKFQQQKSVNVLPFANLRGGGPPQTNLYFFNFWNRVQSL